MKLTNEKTNYIIAPESIISHIRKRNSMMLRHLLPSLIITLILVVRLFPILSNSYNIELNKNSGFITIIFIITFLPISILNGILLEKYLMSINVDYKGYKESLN